MRKGLFLVLLISIQSAYAEDLSSRVRVQHEGVSESLKKKKRPKKTLQQQFQEQKLEAKRPSLKRSAPEPLWSYLVDYRAATDLQDQKSGRAFSHSLSAGLRYKFMDQIYLSGGVTGAYDSVGTEVLVDGQHAEAYMGDVTLGVSSFFSPTLLTSGNERSQTVSWSIDNEFPTSPYSRAEGYSSVTNGSLSWSFDFLDRYFYVIPSLTGYYIWNRYEKSPTTSATNKMGGVRVGLLLGMRVWKGLFVRLGGGLQSTRYTDGSTDSSARNSFGFGYGWRHLTLAMDFSNGTYADREETHLWFVDQYRRIVSFRATLSF